MCNLYSLTKGQDAIRRLAKAMRGTTGNLPALLGVIPDTPAPVVRMGEDGLRELVCQRLRRTGCLLYLRSLRLR